MPRVSILLLLLLSASVHGQSIGYNRDVLPILSAKCFSCHGSNSASRKAGLRLDVRSAAVAKRAGGRPIVPGRPADSDVVRRIFSTDEDVIMPPSGKGQLTENEKRVIRKWIAAGARYEKHWAFQRPRKTALPSDNGWAANAVDRFVFARLAAAKLSPQRPASRERIIRRLTLDLTGLPPTLADVDAFLADRSPDAYERLVNRLLNSPRYGERMAMWWLDGARYGDSHGYDNDLENSQWPWRNWVIESFNANKPFDQFTIEQLAGDLLPNATERQILATGFNRNHRIQTEGGAIDEEWRTEYVIDRVQTMGSVWMGLTLSCSRCHDHKYDPISQKNFYQLFALFNNLDEKGFINNLRGAAEPRIRYRAKLYARRLQSIQKKLKGKARDQEVARLNAQFPQVMIMREMRKRRKSFVLVRGQYNRKGSQVVPGLPRSIAAAPDKPVSRLTLAQWLVDGRHPLTARVFVNRVWEQLFGVGLVKSSENLGVQGDWPSHPQLLDWLAVEFAESGWNVKGLVRLLVTSNTYRQSSIVDRDRLRVDPENRLLSRGPRVRLQAELLRDQALAISGLLYEEMGGPSVRPYQPAGLWEEIVKRGTFQQSSGRNLYRRGFYTAIRRTMVTPALTIFDMPSREVCTVRRSRTNTPLQALALLNNVTYVEAARRFAERIMQHGETPQERITWAFRRATARRPSVVELKVLTAGYERRLKVFRSHPTRAAELLKQGDSAPSQSKDTASLAAMTTVANILLNLDEIINK